MSTYEIDVPRLMASDHRIKNCEQFTHTSSNGHFFELASSDQSLMKTANDGVRADCRQSGHIENTTNIMTAGLDMASTAMQPRIAIERSNTNQSGNLMSVELTQLWQARQHGVGGCGSNAFTTTQQIIFLPPGRTRTDLIIEVFFQLRDVLLQPLNVFPNERPHRRGRTMKSILLRRQHPDQLSSARADRFQLLGGFICDSAQFRANFFTECRQDVSIYGVALRQSTNGSSEVSRLTWIDGDRRQSSCDKTAENQPMIGAGRLQYDQRRRYWIQCFNDLVNAVIVVAKLHPLIGRTDSPHLNDLSIHQYQ